MFGFKLKFPFVETPITSGAGEGRGIIASLFRVITGDRFGHSVPVRSADNPPDVEEFVSPVSLGTSPAQLTSKLLESPRGLAAGLLEEFRRTSIRSPFFPAEASLRVDRAQPVIRDLIARQDFDVAQDLAWEAFFKTPKNSRERSDMAENLLDIADTYRKTGEAKKADELYAHLKAHAYDDWRARMLHDQLKLVDGNHSVALMMAERFLTKDKGLKPGSYARMYAAKVLLEEAAINANKLGDQEANLKGFIAFEFLRKVAPDESNQLLNKDIAFGRGNTKGRYDVLKDRKVAPDESNQLLNKDIAFGRGNTEGRYDVLKEMRKPCAEKVTADELTQRMGFPSFDDSNPLGLAA